MFQCSLCYNHGMMWGARAWAACTKSSARRELHNNGWRTAAWQLRFFCGQCYMLYYTFIGDIINFCQATVSLIFPQ